MTATHTDLEARKERALRRLGTRNPICSACGESDWRCMERHHIASEGHHDDTALVCRNCHRKLSDHQHDHPADIAGRDASLATIGHYLVGLADLFRMIAESLLAFGRRLIEQARPEKSTDGGGVS